MVMVAVEVAVEILKKMDSHSLTKSVMLVVEEAVAVLVFLLVLVVVKDLEMVVKLILVLLDLHKQVESKVEQVEKVEIMQMKQ